MGRFSTASQKLRSARVVSCGVAAVVLFFVAILPLQCQDSGSLRGTVRDAGGNPIARATIQLIVSDAKQPKTVLADAQGNYVFPALHGGIYVLRATMAGFGDAEISSLFIGPREAKNVDLTLLSAKTPAAQPASTGAPRFFDPPQFTVAGVTDTTSLGGHGSDTIVRTRETLAKETVSLGKAPPSSAPVANQSEKSLRESVERTPNNFESNHRLGKALVADGKAAEAIPYLERAGELKPDDYENTYELALANAHAGNCARSRESVRALLAHHDSADLHHLLAEDEEKLHNALGAVREFQRAAELNSSEGYLFDWASELLMHHAPEPALEVFTKGNRLFPGSVRMLIGLGAAQFARGSYDEAAERLSEASDLNPKDEAPYLFMGRMQFVESVPTEKVVEKLHRFLELQPDNADANFYYAAALWKLRKGPEDAATVGQVESFLRNAIRLNPKFGAAYLQLGIVDSEKKQYPEAVSAFRAAIAADPEMEQAHYRLAQIFRLMGDAANADAELRIYDRIAKQSAQEAERERHEIRQFVYTLRDKPAPESP
ncbi:MAG: hypothetical protein DMG79_01710 [Acidobacteria bacterium]|nr:MAG: hypothetical protein DMG79_01710 [Acidobacteriota bacterium]